MLFQSVEFIFLFLPLTWSVFLILLYLKKSDLLIIFIAAASLYFYALHHPSYAFLIFVSLGVNFLLGNVLMNRRIKFVLVVGIIFNLGLLGAFKYTGFVLENVALFAGQAFNVPGIVLPLAISFFTFQQIAYLVDIYKDPKCRYQLHEYALFVLFFPQLIAGPIVHHYEILPQVKSWVFRYRKVCLDLALGLSIFAVGLFKKLLFADNIGAIADDIFSAAGPSSVPVFYDCWYGALAFSLQIYFDFSAYSDMAIGLARMFGIVLPLNFYSPYKASSIIDF
jgi:alginate O-acetyltransferase complex protein AlgI